MDDWVLVRIICDLSEQGNRGQLFDTAVGLCECDGHEL